MQKIISLFQRNYDGNRLVRDEVTPGAEWVQAGEGVATQKLDGTCCLVRDGKLYKRYDRKPTKQARHRMKSGEASSDLYVDSDFKPAPKGWEQAQDPDKITGHWPGWILVGDGPEDRWHREAFEEYPEIPFLDATYELCGPKIQGNPERFPRHFLIAHGNIILEAPRTFNELKVYLSTNDLRGIEELKPRDIEGIVWHHPDGRMVKLKLSDFGIKRGEG